MQVHRFDKKHHKELLAHPRSVQHFVATPAGTMKVLSIDLCVFSAVFVDNDTLPSPEDFFINDIMLCGSDFDISIWEEVMKIAPGTTISYGDIAKTIGKPSAFRAVGSAVGRNLVWYFVPCHRVLPKHGGIGGYAGGSDKKLILLKHEGVYIC